MGTFRVRHAALFAAGKQSRSREAAVCVKSQRIRGSGLREDTPKLWRDPPVSFHREIKFRAVNPHAFAVKDILIQDVECFCGHERFDVVDEDTGKSVPFQISRHSRGPEMCILAEMKPNETRTFVLKELLPPLPPSCGLRARGGAEGVEDLFGVIDADPQDYVYTDRIENEYFRIEMKRPFGVTRIYDKKRGEELLRADEIPFRPVYEVTPLRLTDDYMTVRRDMGRNRKAVRTNRDFGELTDIRNHLKTGGCMLGPSSFIGSTARSFAVSFSRYINPCPALRPICVYIKTAYGSRRTSISRFPLPRRERRCTWTKRARYSVRESIRFPVPAWITTPCRTARRFVGKQGALLLAAQDIPLMTMGSLEARPVKLMGEDSRNSDEVYSWVMNNFGRPISRHVSRGFINSAILCSSPKRPNLKSCSAKWKPSTRGF